MLKPSGLALAIGALALTISAPRASAAVAALFGREMFYSLNSTDSARLKASGFTTAILFVVDVESNGDLNYNGDHLIVQNGTWVGDSSWPTRLRSLKSTPSTIYRIEVCTGGAGAQSFNNIKNLIASQGTGSGSILYRNFQVLRDVLGIDAICYDDEVAFDVGSAVSFGRMVNNLGMKVTLCPYNNPGYWQSVFNQLGTGIVDAVYLQCYDGGAWNDVGSWKSLFGGYSKVYPGDWYNDSLSTIQSKMDGWQWGNGIKGGFIWQAEIIGSDNFAAYANTILNGIGLHSSTYWLSNRNSGLTLDVKGGSTGNGSTLIQWGYNGGGNQQWNWSSLGNNQWKCVGVASGRALDAKDWSTDNNSTVQIYDFTGSGGDNQKFTTVDNGAGYFSLRFVHDGKAVTVFGASTAAGASIVQYDYNGGTNAQWQFRAP